MLVETKARAVVRVLSADVPRGLAVGAVIGFCLGAGFLAGGLADDAVGHAKVVRIAKAANRDFTDAGLAALGVSNPGALNIALRYDPSLMLGAESDERQSADLTAALERRAGKQNASYVTAGARKVSNPAARPWTASPLDETRQLDCLTQAVYYEARGETPAGQAAVAQVVLNRVRHPAFPKSICGVVYQGAQNGRGCQFSFACNGAMRGRREGGAWERAERIASRALNGYVMAEVGNATHFHVTSINPRWGNLLRVAQVGMHVFYRFGGKAGSPGAFIAEPEVQEAPAETPIMAASLTVVPAETVTPPPLLTTAANAVVDAVVKLEAPTAQAAPAPAKPEPPKPAA